MSNVYTWRPHWLTTACFLLSLAGNVGTSLSQDAPLGDPPPVEWRQVYGGPDDDFTVTAVSETADGGFILAGGIAVADVRESHLMKTDANGAIEWMKKFAGGLGLMSVVEFPTGGFVRAGRELVTRVDASGEHLWDLRLPRMKELNVLVEPDSSLRIVSLDSETEEVILTHVNEDGDILRQNRHSVAEGEERVRRPSPISGGGATIALTTRDDSGSGALRLDGHGNVIWKTVIPSPDPEAPYRFVRAVKTSDGGVVAMGAIGVLRNNGRILGHRDLLLARFDSDGELSWLTEVGVGERGFLHNGIVETRDGGFLYATARFRGARLQLHATRFDPDGGIVWQYDEVSPIDEEFRAVARTRDGGYIAAGIQIPAAPINNDTDNVILMKFGPDVFIPTRRDFRRGDVTSEGELTLTDAVVTLEHLFLGGAELGCDDAADADDNGTIQVTDAVYVLTFLFGGGPPPGPPFAQCGVDSTDDALGCSEYPECA